MKVIWWVFSILLVAGIVVLTIIVCIGVLALLLVSMIECVEKKLRMVTIGEDEEELMAQAQELREKQTKAFRGPWTLTPQVRPYDSKAFQFFRAKETVEGKRPDDPSEEDT